MPARSPSHRVGGAAMPDLTGPVCGRVETFNIMGRPAGPALALSACSAQLAARQRSTSRFETPRQAVADPAPGPRLTEAAFPAAPLRAIGEPATRSPPRRSIAYARARAATGCSRPRRRGRADCARARRRGGRCRGVPGARLLSTRTLGLKADSCPAPPPPLLQLS